MSARDGHDLEAILRRAKEAASDTEDLDHEAVLLQSLNATLALAELVQGLEKRVTALEKMNEGGIARP
jgi:hypothetical protein